MVYVIIIIGIILLPVLYNALFPFRPPVLENYFTPGQTFISKAEGVTQNTLRRQIKTGMNIFACSIFPGLITLILTL